MTGNIKSCAVAFPTQRNCATPETGATDTATNQSQTGRKPASIRELRAQLQAQQSRNQESHAGATKTGKVAHQVEIWGPFTPWTAPIGPELVIELHRLIAQYAERYRLADDETARIIAAAKRQPAATVPESIRFFQNELKEKS